MEPIFSACSAWQVQSIYAGALLNCIVRANAGSPCTQSVCTRTLLALLSGTTASCPFVKAREYLLLPFSLQLDATPPIWLSFLTGQLNSISGENARPVDHHICRGGGSHGHQAHGATGFMGDRATAFPGTTHIAHVNSTATANQAIAEPKRYARGTPLGSFPCY